MSCTIEECTLKLYLTDDLPDDEKEELENHLRSCSSCVQKLLKFGRVQLEKTRESDRESGLPSQFGPYSVKFLLAAGGRGFVYQANDTQNDRMVALKIIRPDILESADAVRRFVREARLAMSLQHPNIVRVFDTGEIDGRLFIAMEFVDGPNLHQYVRHRLRLPIRTVAIVARQMARALQAAHKRNIIHRDLKPSNVLISRAGVAKVADFGLACEVVDDSVVSGNVRLLGSMHCIPPEQIRGGSPDFRSDIYGFGCVLFFMATSRFPFHGDKRELLRCHLQEPAPAPGQMAPDIPPWFDELVLRCLEKDKDRRWPDIGALLQALEAKRE